MEGQTSRMTAIIPRIAETKISPIVETEIIPFFKFADYIQPFLDTLDVREISKEVYRKGVVKFLAWMKTNEITQPDRRQVLQFKTFLIESGLSVNSVNSILTSVKQFFAFLFEERIYPNISKGIRGLKNPRGYLKESPSLDQVREMLSRIDISTNLGLRNFAVINTLARTGIRTVELIRLDIGDMTTAGEEAILKVWGKGRDCKDDCVLLTKQSLNPIMRYLKTRPAADPADPLFVSLSDRNPGERLTTRTIRGLAKNLFRKIGIDSKKMSCHSLRHFCATESIRNNAPLIQVKSMMRHSNLTTTQKYVHAVDRIENAAERFIDF